MVQVAVAAEAMAAVARLRELEVSSCKRLGATGPHQPCLPELCPPYLITKLFQNYMWISLHFT